MVKLHKETFEALQGPWKYSRVIPCVEGRNMAERRKGKRRNLAVLPLDEYSWKHPSHGIFIDLQPHCS